MGGGRAKEFFLSIRESCGECEKTSAKLDLLGVGDKAPLIAVK